MQFYSSYKNITFGCYIDKDFIALAITVFNAIGIALKTGQGQTL
jgi:hypothetical protein